MTEHAWGWAILALLLVVATGCAHGRLPEISVDKYAAAPGWPQPPSEPRVVMVGTLASSADVRAEQGWLQAVLQGVAGDDESIALARPMDVVRDAQGRVLVADAGLGALVIFDVDKGETRLGTGNAGFMLLGPVGVATDSAGAIYVSDPEQGAIAVFDVEGTLLRVLGQGALQRPTGIAYLQDSDQLAVVDTGAHAVVVLGVDGKVIARLGSRGTGPCQFNFPVDVVEAASGELWVLDSLNYRVQQLGVDGGCTAQFGKVGDSAGSFARPKGLALDGDGHVLVSDAMFGNVQLFEPSGELLFYFSQQGEGPGDLSLPAGMFMDASGLLLVADPAMSRVLMFRFVQEEGE